MREHNFSRLAPIRFDYVYSGGERHGAWDTTGETFSIDQVVSDDSLVKPLLPKPHSYRIRHSKALTGFRSEVYNSYQFNWNGALAMKHDAVLPHEPYDMSVIENEALDKLNQKIRGSLDLSISAFEIKQTRDLLKLLTPKGLANHAQHIYQTLKFRGKPGSFWDWIKDASGVPADLWLQYQYGLKPLLSDVFGAALEAQGAIQKGLTSFTASSMRRVEGQTVPYIIDGTGSWEGYKNLNGKWACKYGLVLDCGLTTPERLQHWSSLNPVSIVWERIPYSFVADWFYDIGGFLHSIETSLVNDVSFVAGYKSTITAYDYYPLIEWKNKSSGGALINGQCSGYNKYVYFERKILDSYPLPNLPRFKSDLGATRLISAAALLQQWLPKRVIIR